MKKRKSCPIDNCGECKYGDWFRSIKIGMGGIYCKILRKKVSSYGESLKTPNETGGYEIDFSKTPKAQGIHKDCPLKDYKSER